MTQQCWKALTRSLVALVALVTVGVGALQAQSTGKIQGTVKDPQGRPINAAEVEIVGTAYTAKTNAQGYYFIENVPAGTVALLVKMIGFKPIRREALRVMAGQTRDENFTLEATPVTLTDLQATTQIATNPLVPRDQVTSKQTIDGAMAQKLPVDRIGQLLALQPGVTQVNSCPTNAPCVPLISVRGGRVDQNLTYIDGVPVAVGIHSGTGTSGGNSIVASAPQIAIATGGLEEASITTGASSVSQAGAQSGIVNISTRSGGNKFAGDLRFETGLLGFAKYGQGFNQFAGSFGGPIAKGLTFFLSGQLEGVTSNNGGAQAYRFPQNYAAVGVDTQYTIAKAGVASATAGVVDSVTIPVYKYALTEGACNSFKTSPNTDIASNYGVKCVANQLYATPSTNYLTNDKLSYSFGQGSRLALSYNFSGNQTVPQLGDGLQQNGNNSTVTGANLLTLNWTQTLIRSSTHQLSFDAFLSKQWSNATNGLVTAESQQSALHNSPLGIITKKLKYAYGQDQYPLDSTLIYNILYNNIAHRIGIFDSKNTGQYNAPIPNYATLNGNGTPDGVGYATGGTGADDNGLTYTYENRLLGRLNLDFQADRYNRLTFGGDYTQYTDASNNNGNNGAGVYFAKPLTYDAYAEDRIDLGDVVLQAGLRYDYYWSKIWRWNEYPEIATRPGFTKDSLFCAPGAAPSATAKCALVQDPSHNYLSPHIQVSFPVNTSTNFRLSYAQNVQPPNFALLLQNSLADINTSGNNSRSRWGQDLDFGKTITFEFGARHAFSEDMVLDVAVYNNDNLANPSYSFQHPIDPKTGSASVLYLAENTDFGNTRGVDVRLDRRLGEYFNGSVTYSYQDAKNTGTDPASYLGFFEPLSGFAGDPPTAALPTGTARPHSLTAIFNAALPADFAKGSLLGSILHRTGVFVTARLASGTAYTRCDPTVATDNLVVSGGSCTSVGSLSSGYNAARLPSLKQFDMRLTRDFNIGKNQLTAYADIRNLFNFAVVQAVYAQTGTQISAQAIETRWATDSSVFKSFGDASRFNVGRGDGALALPSTIAACGKVVNGTNSLAPQCFYYYRSEQRFGNGDHIYTLAEQRAASDSKNARADSEAGPVNNPFLTGARTIRFGLELSF